MKINFLAALPFLMVAIIPLALSPVNAAADERGHESQVSASRDPSRSGWRRIGISLAELERTGRHAVGMGKP